MNDKQQWQTYLGERGMRQATHTLSRGQKVFFALIILALIGLCVAGKGQQLLFVANSVFAGFFLLATLYRAKLVDISLNRHREIHVDAEHSKPRDWPHYVVQVPLYKEPNAIPKIISGLSALDYPKEKLTIQLLVEADDEPTLAAVAKAQIQKPFVLVEIPVCEPRTKPKACNVGLAFAEGDYLVIYDAEDRPEPDQLKKAVLAFDQSEDNVACIQAKLCFYNSEHNLITRCFTAEYSMWFDLCLPGLDVLQAPIPLGGTSNHFKLSVLKELQGWDEFNVTEDCDLGLRLFSAGYRTRMLDSTTWEEACSRWPVWFRQRSRWVKGYVQTYLVHCRHLFSLCRDVGITNSLHFHLLVGGSVVSQLLSPFYWALVLLWLCSTFGQLQILDGFSDGLSSYYPIPVFAMAAICLFIGNFLMIYGCALACAGKNMPRLIKYTPFMLVYWLVMGLAAWKGTLQLIWRPHYWEKTQHYEGD